jgi:catechol 2,3-dioxygenase-like lactoylglutathione lyase family enzyme
VVSDTFIKRCTLVLPDLRRSLAFYRDVMGLSVYYDQPMTVGGRIIPAGIPGARVQLAIMEANHPTVGKIGLLQWTDPPLPTPTLPFRRRLGIGDLAFVMETPEPESLYARLQAVRDVEIQSPPVARSVPTPDGRGQIEMCTFSFFSPDGTFFAVNHKRNAPNLPALGLRRTTLIVRDLDVSLRFYREVMGMELRSDQTMSLDGQWLPTGTSAAQVREVIFKGDDSEVGMLGLMAFLDPVMPEPPSRQAIAVGDSIFVAHARDVHEIARRMQNSPARIHAPPQNDRAVAAKGGEIRMTTMSFFDPDGYFFELNTRQPP